MLAKIWAAIELIKKLYSALESFIAWVKQVRHESAKKEIKEKTDIAGDPTKPTEDRLDAIKDIEDRVNDRT